jgi:hypothetical protein
MVRGFVRVADDTPGGGDWQFDGSRVFQSVNLLPGDQARTEEGWFNMLSREDTMEVASLLERMRQCAMPDGAFQCKGTWLRQEGEMRLAPDRPWLPFTAEEWFPGAGIEFRWQAKIRIAPFLPACVVDSFEGGRGVLTARVLGFPIAKSRGHATDKAEAMRGLAELPWRPFAFEAPCLTWETMATDKLRVRFDDGRTQAEGEFEIDSEGYVLAGTVPSRPRLVGKSLVETPWSGTFGVYRMFDGVRLPTTAEATWHLPEGPFGYWRGRVTDFRVLR